MAVNIPALRAKALATLTTNGGLATLRFVEPGQFDPITDTVGPSNPREFTVPVVLRVYAVRQGVGTGSGFEPGGMVTRGGESVLVAAASLPDGVEPKPGWQVILGTRVLAVMNVATERPDGATPIIHTLACSV